jgi:hypothetical protein
MTVQVSISAIQLVRDSVTGCCEVRLEVAPNEWLTVIQDCGDVISHIVEAQWIERCIQGNDMIEFG